MNGPAVTAGRARIQVPAAWAARARDLAAGGAEPAVPRDAASVMLLRPAAGHGIEVFLLRRRASMAFAAGASVFPGGAVDGRDTDSQVRWAGPGIAEWAAWLGAPPELARGLLCAAVRETFEEAGVLLAGPPGGGPLPVAAGQLERDRLSLLDRSLSLAGLLAARGLVLRSDLLRPWARWVTPAAESRRYDARFFAAALPAGQLTGDIRDEADQVGWLRPPDVLAAARRGEIALMPPTAVTLAELAGFETVDAALAAPREVVARLPEVIIEGDHAWLVLPAGLLYPL